jgi:5-methylthioadenosine/S-adenosylhomocysteine deaminase
VRRLSDRTGAPILIHLSETEVELSDCRAAHQGLTPPQYLDSLGFLGPRVLAAHCVSLTAEDMTLLRDRGVACAHNPESNMKLASGKAPVAEMLAAGMTVGLGTDGPAGSNDNYDMFEAMDFAGKLAKVQRGDPTALPARQILALATIEGARGLGLADRIGSLAPGKAADLIVIDTDSVRLQPYYDPYAAVVYAAKGSDVRHVLVDGAPLLLNRELVTLDQRELLRRALEYRRQVLQAIGRAP